MYQKLAQELGRDSEPCYFLEHVTRCELSELTVSHEEGENRIMIDRMTMRAIYCLKCIACDIDQR